MKKRQPRWANLPTEELLDVRICDLKLKIEGTFLEERIERLYEELERRELRLRPHCWLSEEWFAADGVPGIAIPFYLAHPRLMKLEQHMMLEVEGGTRDDCMRILRHEAGHAIDSAYRLHRRRQWQITFGNATQKYPNWYRAKPHSKNYVLHLDAWYAQSHPSEDFAETFAVWLKPHARWRQQYAGWPAMKKLAYVDGLMKEIAGVAPLVRSRERVDPLSALKKTLREHYQRKRELYSSEHPDFYDRDLKRLFSDDPKYADNESASGFLRRARRDLREAVGHWTGVHRYTIDQVLEDITQRARQLKLRLTKSERRTKQEAIMSLTVQTMNFLHNGHKRVAL